MAVRELKPDEECRAQYGTGGTGLDSIATCLRRKDHPPVSVDGIGHAPHAVVADLYPETVARAVDTGSGGGRLVSSRKGPLSEAESAAVRERQAEAREVGELWEGWEVQEVAVVVFVRARGADAADARDRAVQAVSRAVRGERHDQTLPVTHRGLEVPGARIVAADVAELGTAGASGKLAVTVTRRAFKR